jgi:hypothetical protein
MSWADFWIRQDLRIARTGTGHHLRDFRVERANLTGLLLSAVIVTLLLRRVVAEARSDSVLG